MTASHTPLEIHPENSAKNVNENEDTHKDDDEVTGVCHHLPTTVQVGQDGQHQLIAVVPKVLPTSDTLTQCKQTSLAPQHLASSGEA